MWCELIARGYLVALMMTEILQKKIDIGVRALK